MLKMKEQIKKHALTAAGNKAFIFQCYPIR